MMKRFTNHDDTILDNEGEQLINTDEIVDKLNELADENAKFQAIFNHDPSIADSYKEYYVQIQHDTRETIIKIINKRIIEHQQWSLLSEIKEDSISDIDNALYENSIKIIELRKLKEEIKKYVW